LNGPFPKLRLVVLPSDQDGCTAVLSLTHLGPKAEPPNKFLEENHPMTISSTFSSYLANGFRQEDFYGNSYITGFFINFELLRILTDYAN
jgi:hypothetical protein